VLSVVLKWVGVALLVVACLLGVYLGAGLLGELAVWATYPEAVTFQQKEARGLEEQLLKGLALYLWAVFVVWATRCDWV
jgi:hypothetical protein